MTQSRMTRDGVEIAHREGFFSAVKNRILQVVASHSPGATTWRVWLHRWRGVHIGKDVCIGYDAIIETSWPELVTIPDRATIQIRATIIAHFREQRGVLIEEDATLGPGAIILPNVTIGKGPSWPLGASYRVRAARTVVQGNPARPIATIDLPLRLDVSLKEFSMRMPELVTFFSDHPSDLGVDV